MNPNRTDIVVILDKSGSMAAIRLQTIEAFNKFLRDQKEGPGEVRFTLIQFSTTYDVVHNDLPLWQVPELTLQTYQPEGGTALYDAIGQAIIGLEQAIDSIPEMDRPGKTLVVIVTDGEENRSQEHTQESARALIDGAQAKGWDFIYLGANHDVFGAAQRVGIPQAYAFSAQKTGETMDDLSRGVSRYRVSQDLGSIARGSRLQAFNTGYTVRPPKDDTK